MFAVGYQVQVIGELDIFGNLLQNIDAEAFAALLDVCPSSLCRVAAETQRSRRQYVQMQPWIFGTSGLEMQEASACQISQHITIRFYGLP